jgi:hypothetical protein
MKGLNTLCFYSKRNKNVRVCSKRKVLNELFYWCILVVGSKGFHSDISTLPQPPFPSHSLVAPLWVVVRFSPNFQKSEKKSILR